MDLFFKLVELSFKIVDLFFKIVDLFFKIVDLFFKLVELSFKIVDLSFKIVDLFFKIVDLLFERAVRSHLPNPPWLRAWGKYLTTPLVCLVYICWRFAIYVVCVCVCLYVHHCVQSHSYQKCHSIWCDIGDPAKHRAKQQQLCNNPGEIQH